MKTLVVYYSLDGNTALVAAELGRILGADLLELKFAGGEKRTGPAKYIWGGKMVFSHEKPALKPYTADLSAYDLVVLGGPVWAGSPSPALVSFLSETGMTGKKTAIFCCHGGGKGKALSKLRTLLAGNEIAGQADFRNPVRGGPETWESKAADWANRLSPGTAGHPGTSSRAS
ncbi:MAG: NAD(P)H-dependent oxidoreductase [Treponema sp.]|jgi:flavodoxin|nr:NAD(P)H-dependent oxidoreductase [Treponema sp.]